MDALISENFIEVWEKSSLCERKLLSSFVKPRRKGCFSATFSKLSEFYVSKFWSIWLKDNIRIAPTFTCHFWIGYTDKKLNAIIYVNNKKRLVQEVLWELNYGFIPKNKHLLNKCGTPDCVNLKHYVLAKTNGK